MSDTRAATGNMVLERDFAASPQEVYEAFTDPDRLAQWFGPLGFHVPRSTVRVDARPGGFWRLVMVNNENRAITSPVDSVFTEVIPNERLVGYEDTRGMPGVPDGTRLVYTATEKGGQPQLYALRPDGRPAQALTAEPGGKLG